MKKKASLTVYAALSLMLVAQFLFVIIESARYQEISKISQMRTASNIESAFAAYCSPLWENYHILAINGGDFEGEFSTDNISGIIDYQNYEIEESFGTDLLRIKALETQISSYTLLTDESGRVFYNSVADYMKENIAYEEAKFIYSYYESIKDYEDGGEYKDSSISDAVDGLENPSKYDEDDKTSKSTSVKKASNNGFDRVLGKSNNSKSQDKKDDADNKEEGGILSTISQIQKKGILEIIVPKGKKLSEATFEKTDRLSERKKNQGNSSNDSSSEWYSRVLFEQYLINYMGSYTNPKEGHGLSYELEYIIGGKDSDIDNLKSVVRRLLAIREGANMLYLITDVAKKDEALALATVIAGASANPLLIEAVKYGLLAAWAYCESILDLRALLQGDRVVAIKSKTSWTSDLSAIGKLISGNAKAKTSKTGLSYMDYVGILVLAKGTSSLSYRAMDLMECTIQKEEGYEKVKMDNMVSAISCKATYGYHTIFSNFISLIKGTKKQLVKECKAEYSYYSK